MTLYGIRLLCRLKDSGRRRRFLRLLLPAFIGRNTYFVPADSLSLFYDFIYIAIRFYNCKLNHWPHTHQ